jgi:acetyltransferase-like isoleucine patch superfamily enzyme
MNSDNIFFDITKLKKCGKNVIIGKTVRIRYPELVEIGDNVIIDDFVYISTILVLKNNVHIASGCKLIGGRNSYIEMREFSTISPNIILVAGSDDYYAGIAGPTVPFEFKGNVKIGKIILNKHCIAGASTVVLPNVEFKTGSAVGALSLVKSDLDEWTLYAGVPAMAIKKRDKEKILSLEKQYKESQYDK